MYVDKILSWFGYLKYPIINSILSVPILIDPSLWFVLLLPDFDRMRIDLILFSFTISKFNYQIILVLLTTKKCTKRGNIFAEKKPVFILRVTKKVTTKFKSPIQ